jgi:hypothetical protein
MHYEEISLATTPTCNPSYLLGDEAKAGGWQVKGYSWSKLVRPNHKNKTNWLVPIKEIRM